MAPASSKEFLDIQATVECGFTLKLVRDMIKTYNPSQVISLLGDGTITERKVENLYKVCLESHRTAFLDALSHFPLEDEFLKHVFSSESKYSWRQ